MNLNQVQRKVEALEAEILALKEYAKLPIPAISKEEILLAIMQDIEMVLFPIYPDFAFFRKGDRFLFQTYGIGQMSNIVEVSCDMIWEIFEQEYKMSSFEVRDFIKPYFDKLFEKDTIPSSFDFRSYETYLNATNQSSEVYKLNEIKILSDKTTPKSLPPKTHG